MENRNLRRVVLLALSALLAVAWVTPAFAVPPLPNSFFGTVRQSPNGAFVPAGTTVTATSGTLTVGQTATIIATDGRTVYQMDIAGDDPDTPQKEGASPGDRISFTIGGVPAVQTGIFQSGSNVQLNLEKQPPAPVPPPVSGGGDGGGGDGGSSGGGGGTVIAAVPTPTPTPAPTLALTPAATPAHAHTPAPAALPTTPIPMPAVTPAPTPAPTPVPPSPAKAPSPAATPTPPPPSPTPAPVAKAIPPAQERPPGGASIVPPRQIIPGATIVTATPDRETVLRLPDVRARIIIPPLSLSETVQYAARAVRAPDMPSPPKGVLRRAIEIKLYDSQGELMGTTNTNAPVSVEMTLSNEDIAIIGKKPENASIYSMREGGKEWVKLNTAVDLQARVARTQVDHFSFFALVIESSSADQGTGIWLALFGGLAILLLVIIFAVPPLMKDRKAGKAVR